MVEAPPLTTGGSTARRALITTLVAVAVVVAALALWKLRVVVALLFVAFIAAAAMRPGVEWLARRKVPRAAGIVLHYVVVVGLIALFLSFVVPHLVSEVHAAINAPSSAGKEGGFKGMVLAAIQRRLAHLPSADTLVHPALTAGETAVKVLVGVLFTGASAAYWIFERDRTVDLVTSFIARPKRKRVRDTWELIDLRLGAFVRGELLLISIAAVLISGAFVIIGEPYWLLLGIAVAILELVPVVGPTIGIVVAAGVGLTHSWHTAVFAAGALLAIRIVQDYVINPRVMGKVVGLSPLIVLVSVSAVGILFGGFYVLLAVPIASVLTTTVDVVLRGVDPAQEAVPKVLFAAQEAE